MQRDFFFNRFIIVLTGKCIAFSFSFSSEEISELITYFDILVLVNEYNIGCKVL